MGLYAIHLSGSPIYFTNSGGGEGASPFSEDLFLPKNKNKTLPPFGALTLDGLNGFLSDAKGAMFVLNGHPLSGGLTLAREFPIESLDLSWDPYVQTNMCSDWFQGE